MELNWTVYYQAMLSGVLIGVLIGMAIQRFDAKRKLQKTQKNEMK